jgi:RNA polymerase sigma-70 factor (ECF subfamily)
MIYSYCYRNCLDQAAAQDIAQETFIKAARALATFRLGASFRSWLYRIATNTARDWQRSRARENRLAEQIAQNWSEEAECEAAPATTEEHARVFEALQSLPNEWREAVVLVFYEEMNHAAAAQILGCAETTISWRIFRAKQKLKKLLTGKGSRR